MRPLTTALITAILLTAFAAGVLAAETPTITLNAQDMKIDQAAAELTKQTGIQVVCDTEVKGTVNGSFSDIGLEPLLDIITKANNLKWQKLYLPAQAEKKPTLEQIKAQANALSAIADTPLVVYDPVTKKETVFVRQASDTPAVSTEKLGLKPLYLISSVKVEKAEKDKKGAASDDLLAKYQKLQEERMKALMELTPEQRVAAIQQEMVSQLGMDPDLRLQMMKDQFLARQNMPQNIRDQYRQIMRDTFRQLRDQGLIQHNHDWGDHGHRDRSRDGQRG